ncbi:hypothetical protein AWC38_SpisGene670 [Stylophora pistillata]|uniref:Uncharacterized protein n=1 Tax=Stylophora pistillata TaxID=50429 RepID=A0A2B4T1A7_STYPI|nr:hypothetical protein AWC38_SpisGene670 [Stylophora pistillata]
MQQSIARFTLEVNAAQEAECLAGRLEYFFSRPGPNNQARKLAGTESEICLLCGQLKSIAIQHEGLQEEIDCLTIEKKTLELFKSESLKNHEAFRIRVTDLEKELKVLTTTHKNLEDEAKRKGTGLEKATSYIVTLQEENDKLQTDYKQLLEEHANIKLQLSERIKNTKEAKNKHHQLKQEIMQLRMERDLQCGKVSILEEKILNQQQNHNNMMKEQDRLMKDKAEQDQKIQREIHDRLCLKMVNDLLKEESAIVKDAFQKLEEFVNSLEQSSKSMSYELEQCKQENLKSSAGKCCQVVVPPQRRQFQAPELCLTEHFTPLTRDSPPSLVHEELFVSNEEGFQSLSSLNVAKAVGRDNIPYKLLEDFAHELAPVIQNIYNQSLKEGYIPSLLKSSIVTPIPKVNEKHWNEDFVLKIPSAKSHCEELENQIASLKERNIMLKKEKEEKERQLQLMKMCKETITKQKPHSFVRTPYFVDSNLKRLPLDKCDLITLLKNTPEESVSTSESHKKCSIPFLQEEVDKIKENVIRSPDLKSGEIFAIFQSDGNTPEPAVNGIIDVRRKLELEKEEAVNKVKEDMKVSFDEVCLELKTVKSELSKIWEVLEIKDKQFEEQSQELEYTHQQSQKWAEELTHLRNDYADLAAITSSRSESTRTRSNTVETSTGRAKSHQLTRRRSDGDIKKSCSPCCLSAESCHTDCMDVKMVAAKDYYLSKRLEDLTADRDSALQNFQDLLHGMQVHSEDDDQLFGTNSKLEMEVKQLTAQKVALEVKSKHLECERDELRNQVEELCRMKTAAEEKAVQVDLILSLRKRENKTTSERKRLDYEGTSCVNPSPITLG